MHVVYYRYHENRAVGAPKPSPHASYLQPPARNHTSMYTCTLSNLFATISPLHCGSLPTKSWPGFVRLAFPLLSDGVDVQVHVLTSNHRQEMRSVSNATQHGGEIKVQMVCSPGTLTCPDTLSQHANSTIVGSLGPLAPNPCTASAYIFSFPHLVF